MAKKVEITPINPTEALRAIDGFKVDAIMLLSVVENALTFLRDPNIDAGKIIPVVTPDLERAVANVRRWIDTP